MAGAEKLIVEFAPRLIALGHEVDVFIFDGVETPFYHDLKRVGVNVMKSGKGHLYPYDIRNLKNLLPVVKMYDIIHTYLDNEYIYLLSLYSKWVHLLYSIQ